MPQCYGRRSALFTRDSSPHCSQLTQNPAGPLRGAHNIYEHSEIPRLTQLTPRLRLRSTFDKVWEVGKAVKIGHGPATVIGETPKVRTPSQAAIVHTLREKGRGHAPHFLVGLFYFAETCR